MQHLVFVYGTLRQGQSNHHYLQNGELLGRFDTPESFALFDLGAYPAMISGKKSVAGEVYIINDEILESLDRLEDVPVEYRREQIETIFGLAWVYLYQLDLTANKEILSGNWCKRSNPL
ncbi:MULTISPECIES: gamma-glutamylcyclotransferase [unclassified Vibrio]|uniref:gamma-glutamylcyclotransferase family protein n=1 Tax=unclassified Vibrio TaxID=2614977 RepID=UPI00031FE082|nr:MULTISPECIES: gamma-glutamylcyclotransferase [unclassified Vibrio]NVN82136.1 gamma-glutamylcyclotransferase [Vibrio sp. Scap16]QLE92688.1 gamma-glutamylcyclotransferase [Vibrio sp. Scap24]UPR57808.1 gamma-glutamylcyclotransferase [Vibrio sp. ED004]